MTDENRAADEVLSDLNRANRGPRFVWQGARGDDWGPAAAPPAIKEKEASPVSEPGAPAAPPVTSANTPPPPPKKVAVQESLQRLDMTVRAADAANAAEHELRMAQRESLRSLLSESTDVAPAASVPLEIVKHYEEQARKKALSNPWEYMPTAPFGFSTHFMDLLAKGVKSEWMPLLDSSRSHFDPAFRVSADQIEELSKGIPDQYAQRFADYLSRSTSLTSLFQRRAQFVEDLRLEQELGAAGLEGTAARILAGFSNPVSLGVGVATAGIGSALINGARVGRVGLTLIRGAEGAVGNVAAEYITRSDKPIWSPDELYGAALVGFAFGTSLSLFERAPAALRADMTRLAQLAQQAREAHAARTAPAAPGGHAGAALNVKPLEPTSASAAETAAKYADAPRAAFGEVRPTVVGTLGSSEDDITRGITYRLFPDAVGHKGGEVVEFTALEYQKIIAGQYQARFANELAPLFEQYAKEKGWGWLGKLRGQREFMEDIGRYMRDPDRQVSSSVEQAAARISKMFEDYKWDAQAPGAKIGRNIPSVAGFEKAEKFADANWLPRFVHSGRFRAALHTYGEAQIERFITNAIRSWNPEIEEKLAERLGKVWVKRMREVDAGMEAHVMRYLSGDDASSFRMVLKEEGVRDEEIESLVKHFERRRESAQHPRAKRRLDFDEAYSEVLTPSLNIVDAKPTAVSISDLLVNDVSELFGMYNRSMSGAIALARKGWASRADFDREIGHMKSVRSTSKTPDHTVARDEGLLRYLYDTVASGAPWRDNAGKNLRDSRFGRISKILTDFNFVRLGGDFGIAQVSELGNVLFSMGLKSAFHSIPSFGALRRNMLTGKLKAEQFAELESAVTLGTEMRVSKFQNRIDDIGEAQRANFETNFWHKASQVGDVAKRITSIASGMAPMTVLMQRWSMGAVAHKIIRVAEGRSRFSGSRLRQMGLDDERIARIRPLARRVEWEGNRIKRFNIDKWYAQDAEAADWFFMAISRKTRQMVQENDVGSMMKFMSHPVARMFLQFRSFMINAYEKQLLYNAKHLDWTTAQVFLATMFFGGLAYMTRTYRNSFGQRDQQKFLDERLATEKIAGAAFNMAGWSTFFPMFTDTVASWAGYKPIFGVRNTDLGTTLLANPATDLLEKAGRATFGAIRAPLDSGYSYSEKDWSAAKSILPWQTMGGIRNLLQLIGSSLPERSELTTQRGR